MCLILFGWRIHPDYPLVVAANRDEFFVRTTRPAEFWADAPVVLAGRDLEAGGTWMGVTRTGRFAALTNIRDLTNLKKNAPSRGQLVADFLTGQEAPEVYLDRIASLGARCNGYNLLIGDGTSLWWSSNEGMVQRQLEPGLYGVSNHLLDTPWPKVSVGKTALSRAINHLPQTGDLFHLLTDDRPHPDTDLPDTGIGLAWERLLSSAFINAPGYGTRSSTTLLCGTDGWIQFDEQTWLPEGIPAGRVRFRFAGRKLE